MCEWKDVKQSGESYAAVCKQRSEVVSENGFKFSTSKTVCIHFHQQRFFSKFFIFFIFTPDPNILLGKTPIKVVKKAKFLGLIFDTKLTFKNHI